MTFSESYWQTILHTFPEIISSNTAYHKYNIICLSETYLDCSVPYDDPRLNLSGYKLVRANNKRGAVCIYFKETFSNQPVPTNSLLEVFIGNEKGFVLSLSTSPSQSQVEFHDFLFSLDELLSNKLSQNPIFILVTGSFYCPS